MNDKSRMRLLLISLNTYLDEYSFYDDETEETIIDGDEISCYNFIMQDSEIRFLTSEKVREIIHILFTDWVSFLSLCSSYGVC